MLENSSKYANKEVQKTIAMATKNVIEATPNVAPNRGEVSGGKIADLVVLERGSISKVRIVLIGGKVVVDEGRIVQSPNSWQGGGHIRV